MLRKMLVATGIAGANGALVYSGFRQAQKNNEAFMNLPREEQKKLYDADPANFMGTTGDIYSCLQQKTLPPMKGEPAIPFEQAYPQQSSVGRDVVEPVQSGPAANDHDGGLTRQQLMSSFLSGSAAGASVAYTLFPFESFKKYAQRRNISFGDVFSFKTMAAHLRNEAFHPFRGAAEFAVNIVPTTAVQLTTDAILKSLLPADSSVYTQAGAAALCGITGALTATPVENFVARLQTMNAAAGVRVPNMYVITDMMQQSFLRPWKSYPMIATRDGIFTFCMLWAAGQASEKAQQQFGESKTVDVGARLAVSVIGAAVSHIPDTIGTNMQVNHESISAWKSAKQIYARAGARGFMHGLPPRLLLFFSFSNAIPYLQKVTDPYAQQVANKVLGKN